MEISTIKMQSNGIIDQTEKLTAGQFFQAITGPQKKTLVILGFGKNNYKHLIGYWCYFGIIIAVIAFGFTVNLMGTLDSFGIRCERENNILVHVNSVDSYGKGAIGIIYIFRILVTAIFLSWVFKFGKFDQLSNIANGESFEAINVLLRKRTDIGHGKFQYTTVSNLIFIIYTLCALSTLTYIITEHDDIRVIIADIFADHIPGLLLSTCLSFAVSIYIYIAALWNIFNRELINNHRSNSIRESEDKLKLYQNSYDALTEFTGHTADVFRFYNIVHIATVVDFVVAIYATFYFTWTPYRILYWIDIIVQISSICAAAAIYRCSSITPELFYRFYKSEIREEWSDRLHAKFESFYQRVAHQWAPTFLDILGVVPLSFAMLGIFAFTAFNWIAVLMQFRQGMPADSGNGTSFCDAWRASMNETMIWY